MLYGLILLTVEVMATEFLRLIFPVLPHLLPILGSFLWTGFGLFIFWHLVSVVRLGLINFGLIHAGIERPIAPLVYCQSHYSVQQASVGWDWRFISSILRQLTQLLLNLLLPCIFIGLRS